MLPDEHASEPRGRGLYKRDGESLLYAAVAVHAPSYTVTVAGYTAPVEGWTLFETEAEAEAGL